MRSTSVTIASDLEVSSVVRAFALGTMQLCTGRARNYHSRTAPPRAAEGLAQLDLNRLIYQRIVALPSAPLRYLQIAR